MNQKQLLRFIKMKLRNEPDEVEAISFSYYLFQSVVKARSLNWTINLESIVPYTSIGDIISISLFDRFLTVYV